MSPATYRPAAFHRAGLFLCALVLSAVLPAQLVLPAVAAVPASAVNADDGGFSPGAPGLGDPYYPLDGNGGYDVGRYLLELSYDPATGFLAGSATIRARATQNLSSFNLDLQGLTVRGIRVNHSDAAYRRSGAELTVIPQQGIRDGREFDTVVSYDGVPKPVIDQFGISGFLRTDDGSLIIGQPHVAATWFPANDHPLDKASFTFKITVPDGSSVVANGVLDDEESQDGKTTWTWHAAEPLATYLATASVGKFNLDRYRNGRVRYIDAIDPDLFTPAVVARTGHNFAWSDSRAGTYTRLTRTLTVPPGGAKLSFWLNRNIEFGRDFALMEARTAGAQDWTTLRDTTGHTSDESGPGCQQLIAIHPFLGHYLTASRNGACSPRGSSGTWWAATGPSQGWEQWGFDLSRFAGKAVELSLTYVTDDVVALDGVSLDDVTVSTGEGTTSFEEDGNTTDGWSASGPPPGSPRSDAKWSATSSGPPSTGDRVQASFNRQPEIIKFLSNIFGPYPFSAAGGTVDDLKNLGFALENQTRPIYSRLFFTSPESGDSVVVHELAHQWVGDDMAVSRWQDIWLNEGFATYAEWLWSESEGRETPQQLFDFYAAAIPAQAPLWAVKIGDPGTAALFDFAVYVRGAMTLQALRNRVGDEVFFDILREWADAHAGGNVSSADFMRLAQELSGQDLGSFFQDWLFTAAKPAGTVPPVLRGTTDPATSPPATARVLEQRMEARPGPR
ncbi:M1 family metallopeptidase [Arthrobacter sp. NPDC056727]|uniref:M1 family metallopeptidase n=1 Tax=Arthrobacter sp. NPDC056727 TaxID=3345927 RepID=UPI003670FE88